jgi:hypothetical protein
MALTSSGPKVPPVSASDAAGGGDVNGPDPAASTDDALVRWDGTTGRVIQNSNAILEDDGALTLTHVADEADDAALTLIVDAAGFGDVKAVDVDFITGAIGAGQDEEAVLINIDETLATGGRVVGIEVLATDLGLAEVDGLETGVGVHPIIQLSGPFGDADSLLVLAVDQTVALSTGGAGNITVFAANNDTVTVGLATTFQEMEIIIDTGANQSVRPDFEISIGVGTWAAFSPTDGTNGFQNTGAIAWVLADVPTWAPGTGGEYLVRITRTRNNLTTDPIVDLIQVSDAIEYTWDKDGDITHRSSSLSGTLTFGATPGITSGTGAQTIDFSATQKRQFTFGAGNAVFTFTAPPGIGDFMLVIIQDGVGGRTATFPGGVKWPGGTTPTLSVGANAEDVLSFYYDGTSYYGQMAADFS